MPGLFEPATARLAEHWVSDAIASIGAEMAAIQAKFRKPDAQIVGLAGRAKKALRKSSLMYREVSRWANFGSPYVCNAN